MSAVKQLVACAINKAVCCTVMIGATLVAGMQTCTRGVVIITFMPYVESL